MKLQLQSSLLKVDGRDIAGIGIFEQQQAAIFVETSDDPGNTSNTGNGSMIRELGPSAPKHTLKDL